jgi:hypothetical protein
MMTQLNDAGDWIHINAYIGNALLATFAEGVIRGQHT